jgi:hypothetical protein
MTCKCHHFLTIKPFSMFTTKKALQDQPIRLQPDQIKEAKHAISAFFESRTLDSIREELNQWYEAAISSNRPGYDCGSNRNDLYYLYKQLELLILAAYIVDKNQEAAQ